MLWQTKSLEFSQSEKQIKVLKSLKYVYGIGHRMLIIDVWASLSNFINFHNFCQLLKYFSVMHEKGLFLSALLIPKS